MPIQNASLPHAAIPSSADSKVKDWPGGTSTQQGFLAWELAGHVAKSAKTFSASDVAF